MRYDEGENANDDHDALLSLEALIFSALFHVEQLYAYIKLIVRNQKDNQDFQPCR